MARIVALCGVITLLLAGGYASAQQHDPRQKALEVEKTDAAQPAHAVTGKTEASQAGPKVHQTLQQAIVAEMHKACLEIFGIPNRQASECSLTPQP